MSFLDGILGGSAKRKAEENLRKSEAYVTEVTGKSLKKQLDKGLIDKQQFNDRYKTQLDSTLPKQSAWANRIAGQNGTGLANAVSRNRIARPVLSGLAEGNVIKAAGDIGQLGAGAARLTGNKSLAEKLDRYAKPMAGLGKVDEQGEFRSRGFGDTLARGAVQLGTDIPFFMVGGGAKKLASTASAVKKAKQVATTSKVARSVPVIKTFGNTANNQYQNSRNAGVNEAVAFGSAIGLGAGSAALERVGLGKIVKPGKLTTNLVSRTVGAGLTEGATEGGQQLLENTVAKNTYDPNRSYTQGVAQATLAGGLLGAGARGSIEVGTLAKNPGARVQEKANITRSPAAIKSDPQFQQFERRITGAIEQASQPNTPPALKANFLQEAKELIKQRNVYVRQQSQGGFVKNPLANDAPQGKTPEEFYLQDIQRLESKYGKLDKSDPDRNLARLADKHFDELDPETQRFLEFQATGTDFESATTPQYRGFANADPNSSGSTVHGSQIYELRQAVDDIRQSTPAPQVGKTPTLESLKQEAKPFVIPKTNPTDVTKLSNKDLEYYGKQGYTSITDKYGNTREITPVKSDGVQRLDSLNPTGGVFVDYNPKTRATMPLADNMTTYDKTAGKAPDELVTIYRGAPKNQKGIVAGDFITTNRELAKSYTGDGNVLEMQVPASHILDDIESPLGEEYLYRPTQSQPPKSPLTVEKNITRTPEQLSRTGKRDGLPIETLKKVDNSFTEDVLPGNKLDYDNEGRFFDNPEASRKKIERNIRDIKAGKKLDPIVIDEKGNILDGQHRMSAYEALGIKEIPVYRPTNKPMNFDNLRTRTQSIEGRDIEPKFYKVSEPKPTPKPTLQDALEGKSTKPRRQLTGKQLDTPDRMFQDPNGAEATAIARNAVASEKADFDNLVQQEPAFNAPAASPTSNSGKRTLQALEENPTLRQAEQQASQSGQEINLFAKKDRNGRSVGVEQFDPETMRIESGFVVDRNGNVLGNHIKVDETGIQINIGGKVVPMNGVIGNPLDWQGSYRVTETMDRNLQRLAPDQKTYKASREYLIDHKNQSEATFKTELRAQRQELSTQAEALKSSKPKGVKDDEFNADTFDFIENKVTKSDLTKKYGVETVAKIETYKAYTKKLYDDILTRVNETFVRFGEQPVEARKDYITHLNELTNKKSFAGDMYESLRSGILGEADGKTRSEVPSNIAGRTENFQPNKKWNRFFQRRTGDTYAKDPFKAVDAYLEPALYNIHMTESAMRARGVEAAFRTASELKDMDLSGLSEETQKALRAQGDSQSRLVTGFQEYANALAGKTQRLDRNIIDMGGGTALKGWQKLQRIGAQSTILGNVNSVISQTLGQPIVLADVGVKNYVKGIVRSLSDNPEIKQSDFINARATNVDKAFKTKGAKVLDAGGVPLQQVELSMVKLTWNAQYEKALQKGFTGKKAILEANRTTEQAVAGRGIADKPEIYRSTAANGILQYTLEVAAQNKKVWQDFTPAQKAKFVVAVFAMNSLVGAVTGLEPLPDFLGAAIETGKDFADEEDDRNTFDKTVGGAQRAAGEFADMNPFVAAVANNVLPTETRKKIFGSESGVGRYEGTAAPVKVIQKGISAVDNLVHGNYGQAAKDTSAVVPYGNQVKKTTEGITTIARGYAVDNSGNPTYAAPDTTFGKAQAVVFGANATPNAQKYYDTNQSAVTGKKDMATINSAPNKLDAVSEIQQRRAEAKMNKEQKAKYDKMTNEQKQAYSANVGRGFVDADGNLTQEPATKTEAKMQKFKSELPKGISEESSKVLTNYNRLTTKARQKYLADPKNELAYTKAKLERGMLEKTLTSAQAKSLLTKIDKLSGKTAAKKTATKTTKAKSSRGTTRKTKLDITKMFAFGSPATSTNKSLRELLNSLT
jgi:hypothetical protein